MSERRPLPRRATVRDDKPIYLRLPETELAKTRAYAGEEGRSIGGFVRRLFTRALADYEQTKETTA